MKSLRNYKYSSVYLATLTVISSMTVQAAEIEKIEVTASKRIQSAQTVGVAINAFNGDDIEDLGLESPTDLAAHIPGLNTANATSGGTPIFAIRGIGLDDFNINNSSGVGVYVDEVFVSSPMLLGFQLMDVERVEVLKGPQGTLYGKNTTGGAINFVTNKPTEDFMTSITASYGRWGRLDLDGFINGAISNNVNGRLAYSYAKQNDGWQTDIDTSKEFGTVDKFSLRGKLDFLLSNSTNMLVSFHTGEDNSTPLSPQNDDSEVRANDTLFYGGLFDGLLDVPADSESVRVGNLNVSRNESGYGAAVTITHEFENFDLTAISGFEHYERAVVDNYDGTSAAFLDLDQTGELNQVSQELRLTSTNSDEYTWVAGINYSKDELDISDDFIMLDSAGVNLTTAYTQESTSIGAYFHNEYQIDNIFRLNAGIRYSNDKRDFIGGTSSTDGSDFLGAISAFKGATPDTGTELLIQNESKTDSNVSGKLGLDMQLNKDLLIYTSVSTSYKAGLFYGGVGTEQGIIDYVKPEEITAFEVGAKSTLLDGSLQINGAIYNYDYKNRQSLVIVEDPVIFLTGTLANIPKSTIIGAELDFQWHPTDELEILGGISYMDAEVDADLTSNDVRGLTLFSNVPKGTSLAQAPQWSFNFLTAYTWDVSDNLYAKAQMDYTWSDKQFAALADSNAQYGSIKSLGGRISLKSMDDSWEIALYAKNITDDISDTYSFTNNSAARTVFRSQPLSYGISFTYNYE